tara:strand:- start:178 stop:894 length:717 start_codon:yes stop_codon:yes gene_type:complete
MFIDTDGIALKQTLYGDNDIIVKVLTEEMGLVSFMVKGGRKGNKKKYLQPLMLVSISFKNNNKKSLQYLNQIRLKEITSEILNNYEKRILGLFLCEIISKCLKEGLSDQDIYNFIYKQIMWLNQKSNSAKYFDIWFLANFTKLLGVSPNYSDLEQDAIQYFSTSSASFTNNEKKGNWDKESSLFLYNILNNPADELKNFSLNNNLSKFVLMELVNYYGHHLNDLKLNSCLSVYNSLKL